VVWAGVASPYAAYRLLLAVESRARAALEGFEILPSAALEDVLLHIPGTRNPLAGHHQWHVLIELVQDSADELPPAQLAEQLMAQMLSDGLIEDAVISANEAQAEVFWKIRDSIAEAERAEGPALQHDISVPVAEMARFIEAESPVIERRFPGTKIVAFGHLGDGNIHYHVKAPKGVIAADWYRDQAETISGHVYDRVEAYGGSLSAEHGIGRAKLEQFSRLADPARHTVLRAIKSALDPKNILNPGKLVPLASDGTSA
jgi:FAD/FMN-containing dehydrogenase